MNRRRRSGIPSRYDGSLIINRRKKRPIGRFIFLALLLLLGLAGSYYLFMTPKTSSELISYLPFPKNLMSLHLLHNGREAILKPDSQLILNPKDSLQLVKVQTDGWISWGTKAVSSEMDVESIRGKPVVLQDLWPHESFETPKEVEIKVLRWDIPIGKAYLLIRLDARDWLQRGLSASEMGRKISYLEKALDENPGNVLVKTQLAGLYFENKQYDKAAALYEEIARSGRSRTILEHLLAVYKKQNQVDKASLVYLDLLKMSDDPKYFQDLVDYVKRSKSRADAAAFLEKHQGSVPKAYANSLQLILADLHTQAGNWSKAAAAYEKVVKSGVKDPNVLYNLSVIYQKSEDVNAAIHALDGYLKKNPSDVKSWMQLAELQEKNGDLSKARSTYETVLQKNPQHGEALVRLVAILEKSNDKKALRQGYEKLAALQPKNKTLQFNLGVIYYEGKEWNKATESFKNVASLDAKDLECRKYLLDLYRKQRNKDAELEMLKTLIVLEPGNSAYYDAVFSLYDEKKDYKGIVSFFQDAAEKQPDSVAMHRYLLYGLLKTDDTKTALKELERLIELQPKEKKYLRQAANLYESRGQQSRALKKLEQLLKLDPNDKEAKDDYMRLKLLTMEKKKAG